MKTSRIIRTYTQLMRLKTFDERFEYLNLLGKVGVDVWGAERYINQSFYKSKAWRDVRHEVIVRDCACDLGIKDREIYDRIIIHHMTPITIEDLENGSPYLLDPEYLICTSHTTHNALHYGDISQTPREYIERRPGDTKLW